MAEMDKVLVKYENEAIIMILGSLLLGSAFSQRETHILTNLILSCLILVRFVCWGV